jgi:hypothetical protein
VRFARLNAERRLGVLGCTGSLLRLAMESMALQERIVFLFLEPIGRARAFLVSRGHVTRRRLAERFSLGAFQSNNLLRHFFVIPLPRPAQRLLLPRPRRLPPRSIQKAT